MKNKIIKPFIALVLISIGMVLFANYIADIIYPLPSIGELAASNNTSPLFIVYVFHFNLMAIILIVEVAILQIAILKIPKLKQFFKPLLRKKG